MTDIANLTPTEGILQITHPATGEELGIAVTTLYIEDDELQRLRRGIRNRANKLSQRGGSFKAEEEEENLHELCAKAIRSWDWGTNTFHGVKPECTPKVIKEVFVKLPWFLRQVNEFISEQKNFFS